MIILPPLRGHVIIASSLREARTLRRLLGATGVTVFDLGSHRRHAEGLRTEVVEMTPDAERDFAHTRMGWDLVITLVNGVVAQGGVSLIFEELLLP